MFSTPASILFWSALAVQLAGFASVVFARFNNRQRRRFYCQHIFVVCLCAVGLATMLAIGLRSDLWISSAATFGIMSVASVCDFRSTQRVTAF